MKISFSLPTKVKIYFICLFLVFFNVVGRAASQFQEIPSTNQLTSFVANVLTKSYYGGGRFHKWNKPVTISLFGRAAVLRPSLERICGDLNQLLAGLPVKLVVVEDNLPTADIWYVILPTIEMIRIQNEEGFFPKNHFDTTTQKLAFDGSLSSYRIYRQEPAPGEQVDGNAETFVNTTFLQALGFTSDLRQQPFGGLRSVWFGMAKDGIAGMNTHARPLGWLSDFDQKMIRFAYEMVPQNAEDKTIKQLVKKRLKEVKLPSTE